MIKRTKKVVNYTKKEFNDTLYRSSLEAWFAKQLTDNNIGFKYEEKSFVIFPETEYNGKTYKAITYTPDFFIDDGTLIEYKGYPNDAWPLKEKMIVRYMKAHHKNWIRINNKRESLSYIAGKLGIQERYVPVRNFEGYYEVSSIGNVIKARRTEKSKKVSVRINEKNGEKIAVLRDVNNKIVHIPVMMIVYNSFNFINKDPYLPNCSYYRCQAKKKYAGWKDANDIAILDDVTESSVVLDVYWSEPVWFDYKGKKGYAFTPVRLHELSGMSLKKCKNLFKEKIKINEHE